ncbi:hypothetical protein AMTR_s00095p00106600 [Amborella trichopoda]|uniref:Uncharacterized protein n=1 Tax=Amborella trichopoda TaxID=13333 RepID=W1NU59_AMBTC|nr:hypothetical protein AMTR_s00095p00106600 [Amborella trichopoda]
MENSLKPERAFSPHDFKKNPDFQAPADYGPPKLQKKLYIPMKEYPSYNFIRLYNMSAVIVFMEVFVVFKSCPGNVCKLKNRPHYLDPTTLHLPNNTLRFFPFPLHKP